MSLCALAFHEHTALLPLVEIGRPTEVLGKDGLPHRYVMVAGGKRRVLKTKEVGIPIPPGAVFDIVSAGGGGWGKPSRRTPAARASDLENGFVTPKKGARGRKRGGR